MRKFNGHQNHSTVMSHSPSLNSGVTTACAFAPAVDYRSRSPSYKNSDFRSPSHGLRSTSPNLRRFNDTRKKQTNLETNVSIPISSQTTLDDNKTDLEVANRYENVSDNGSEISDEGYRSLGIIQNGIINKRASVHSQVSNEDAENSG